MTLIKGLPFEEVKTTNIHNIQMIFRKLVDAIEYALKTNNSHIYQSTASDLIIYCV